MDLFREDIRQYDEKAIEELLVNSLAHRNWTVELWNEVIQTPTSLEFRNPGNFRADLYKVLTENKAPEYKNPLMSEFFQHLKLMEKER
jgi:predicted HTH transcriptional regulator